MIAPGNHWILDSLRGAPPPGEAIGRYRARCFLAKYKKSPEIRGISFYSVAAITAASGAAAAGGAADAFVAGLFGAVDGVACAAQDGGQDGDDEKIHITSFLSCSASRRP